MTQMIEEIEEVFTTPRDDFDDEVYKVDEFIVDENQVRIKILKKNINFQTVDWSSKIDWLKDLGYYISGITANRYSDHIFIWVEEWQ